MKMRKKKARHKAPLTHQFEISDKAWARVENYLKNPLNMGIPYYTTEPMGTLDVEKVLAAIDETITKLRKELDGN